MADSTCERSILPVTRTGRRSREGAAQTSILFKSIECGTFSILGLSPKYKGSNHSMPTKLFVGGIPYRTSDQELQQLFSQAGEVVSVFIPMDRETQRPRGFAFVEMADDAGADKAISMFDGSDMGGRRIAVNKARPMEERAPRRM